ncbi:MAG: CYTH domain-containing protein [Deltaproteobacteria bacterium]
MVTKGEKETKILLSKNEYERLIRIAKRYENRKMINKNYYFDTPEFLFYKKGIITFRLREIIKEDKRKYEVIFKTKNQSCTGSIKTSEIDIIELEKELFERILNEKNDIIHLLPELVKEKLYNLGFSKINYVGNLITERTKFKPIQNLFYLELDKNKYLGVTDWELEYEFLNDNDVKLIDYWLKSHQIFRNEHIFGKYERFMNKYMENIS